MSHQQRFVKWRRIMQNVIIEILLLIENMVIIMKKTLIAHC
jgi:hypothetical protein